MVTIRAVMLTKQRKHKLTGSGDNQVVAVNFPIDDALRSAVENTKSKLAQVFSDIGSIVKIEKTWHSGLDVNAGANDLITTTVNGGIGMARYTPEPLIGPIFAYTEIYTILMSHPAWRDHLPTTRQGLVLLTCLTSDFGFLPCIPVT